MAATTDGKITVQLAQLGGTKEPFEVDPCWNVGHLLAEICTKFGIATENVKLLCKGKMLNSKIAEKTLKSLKIKENDKIIIMNKPQIQKKVIVAPHKTTQRTETTKRTETTEATTKRPNNIEEIKCAAEKLAERDNDGYDWNSSYYIELRNQYGDKITLPSQQRQALTVGLTLHEKGKKFMRNANYSDAIYIMKLAFESLSKVNAECVQNIDNYGLLALDIVWCHYLNNDETNLSNAAKWLQIAEYGLRRAHGKNMERLKQIRGDLCFIPELALYVRLNILRALQSFYNNDMNGSRSHLLNAEIDMRKLAINDMDLVKLQTMGFNHKESRRALRFCSGNMDAAINYIYNKREETERKRDEEQKHAKQRSLQRKYGHTQNGKFVDLDLLQQLCAMGVEHEIAVEALRQTNNVASDAINLCIDPNKKQILSQTLFETHFNDKCLDKIQQMITILGITESRARAALFLCYNDIESAINMLSAPTPTQIIDLDRIELRFIPYVAQRQQTQQTQQTQQKEMNNEPMMIDDDDDDDDGNKNENENENEIDDDLKKDENGDDVSHNLVHNYAPIQPKVTNDDDMKIETHILPDLDNDDESYLDIDLTKEQDALNNLRVLLNSIEMNHSINN